MNSLSHWNFFIHHSLRPEDARALSRQPQDKLTLAENTTLQPITLDWPGDVLDLDTLRPEVTPINDGEYALAVAHLNTPEPQRLHIGLGSDWWHELYLNGECVGSTRNTGNGTPDFDLVSHIYTVETRAGDNCFVVWLRRGTASWAFNVGILPPPPNGLASGSSLSQFRSYFFPGHPRIISGPFLKATDGALQVQVELFHPLAAFLQIRQQGTERWHDLHECVLGQIPVNTHHTFTLPSLAPDTTYEYRVKTADTSLENEEISPTYTFRTPPEEKPTHTLFCTADLQMRPAPRKAILEGFLDHDAPKADLFCTLGDLLNSTENLFRDYFLKTLNPVLEHTTHRQIWLPVRGNHELRGNCSSEWLRLFGNSCYLFRYADTAYLVLDSGDDKRLTPAPHVYTRRTDHTALFNAQREWLLQAIATPDFQTAHHRIILCHATPFDQDADFEEFHEQFMARNLQRLLGDFFYGPNPRYKIDLWLAGHTHRSARYTPKDQKIVSFSEPGFHQLTPREKDLYPFPVVVLDGPGNVGPCQASGLLLTITPDYIEVLSRQPTGEIIDHIRIHADLTVTVLETALQ